MTHQMDITQHPAGVYHFKCPECGRYMIQDHTDPVNMLRTIVDPGNNSVGHNATTLKGFGVGVEANQKLDMGAFEDFKFGDEQTE